MKYNLEIEGRLTKQEQEALSAILSDENLTEVEIAPGLGSVMPSLLPSIIGGVIGSFSSMLPSTIVVVTFVVSSVAGGIIYDVIKDKTLRILGIFKDRKKRVTVVIKIEETGQSIEFDSEELEIENLEKITLSAELIEVRSEGKS